MVLLEAAGLLPATPGGDVLPLDPAGTAVDLPLLRVDAKVGSSRGVNSRRVRAMLSEIGRLEALDPSLLARVSEIREDQGGLLLSVTEPRAEVRIPVGADRARLAELRSALEELRRLLPAESTADAAPVRVDLRFKDQIVIHPLTRA